MKIEESIGVYIMDRDGRNPKMLVSNADAFSISPEGKQVVYQTIGSLPKYTKEGKLYYERKDIYLINTDGTGKRLLVEWGQNPLWSPDGKWILYHVGGQAYLINPDGKEKQRVKGYGRFAKDGESVLESSGQIVKLTRLNTE